MRTLTITAVQNTIATQVNRGCPIIFSTRDSTLINNCFAFTGNEHIAGHERRSDWETFTCDYNNYPAVLRSIAPRRPPPGEDISHPGSWAKTAKRLHYVSFRKPGGWERIACYSLSEWQEKSGKDGHSIYRSPLFVSPTENDWRVEPNSPNIGAGKDGALIGALGPVEKR